MTLTPRVEPLTEPRERTASDVLLAAARYIEEHGWGDGNWAPRDGALIGPVCVEGAIAFAMTGRFDRRSPLWTECRDRFMAAVSPTDANYPWVWNDTPGRTEAEVIAALRAAAGTAS